MDSNELASFVREYVTVRPLDVELARRTILEHLASDSSLGEVEATTYLANLVQRTYYSDTVALPEGYTKINPNLNETKARLVTFEALQTLHAAGAIIATSGEMEQFSGKLTFNSSTPRYMGVPIEGLSVHIPLVHHSYRLATQFSNANFRLASGDIYMSRLNQSHLPSRAKRCLDECISAFKHGLYLSATLNAGAASENVWMELARRVERKTPTAGLTKALNEKRINISTVIEEVWKTLESHCITELHAVFPVQSEREAFKDQADRLREHRNYAAHVGDARSDEHYFTYDETGILLLDASGYFEKLVSLYAQFVASP